VAKWPDEADDVAVVAADGADVVVLVDAVDEFDTACESTIIITVHYQQ